MYDFSVNSVLKPALLFTFCYCCFVVTVHAQEDKSLDESLKDLKNAFSRTKAFVLPISDTSDERVTRLASGVRAIEGVRKATLVTVSGKTQIKIDSKLSLNEIWKALPADIHGAYTSGERKGEGLLIEPPKRAAVAKNVNQQMDEEVNASYQAPARSNKSILDQQKDYAEEMRARDKKMEQEIYSRNDNLYYKNPEKYDTAGLEEKGMWFAEYTLNGKKVTIYQNQEKLMTLQAGTSGLRQLSCTFRVPKPYKECTLSFTHPAYYPDVHKFEFNKPMIYSTVFMADYVNPTIPSSTKGEVRFYFDAKVSPGNSSVDLFHVSAITGNVEEKKNLSYIESGYFEVVYFESRENGILEARFAFTAKNVGGGFGSPRQDIVVTDGRIRIRVDNKFRNLPSAKKATASR